MECSKCSMAIQPDWQFCPKCGILLKRTEAIAAAPAAPPPAFGAGVRAQVFEVIVRQAMAGAPWKMICQGPMTVNGISEEEVEAEVRRRGGGAAGIAAPKSPNPSGGGMSEKRSELAKSGQGKKASDANKVNEDLVRENARVRQQFKKETQRGRHQFDGRPRGS